jgi:nucleoside-diphosphate-sugar epimerase
VFCGNTTSTFTVLDEAGSAGVRRAVIASSYSITGLPFAPVIRHPAYLPIDEDLPVQIEDPYALSKQVDELSAGLMWWRHQLSVVAIRFPFLGGLDWELPERSARIADDPAFAATEFWTYLETRDAATACVQGLLEPPPGCHVLSVAAPNTLAPYPTEQLLDSFHPDVPRRTTFPGHAAPISSARAQHLLKWSARHLWVSQPSDLAGIST